MQVDLSGIIPYLGGLTGLASLVSAYLIYKRAGETATIAATDVSTKQWQAINDANDKLRKSLFEENQVLRKRVDAVDQELQERKQDWAKCIETCEELTKTNKMLLGRLAALEARPYEE